MNQSILIEAARLVDNDRAKDYGDPRDDFKRIATIWSTLLENKLNTDWIDIAGYAHCADLCTTYKQQYL